ncbi:MAG TPA: PD-(D/E)XK nuclease family protein, partial [Lacibacter sp.]|nr:PD-(D/E)XK nuclease family protein [Lacibacter sp.]
RISQYETQREEMIGLAVAIRSLLQQQVPPGSIAVIYRENKYGEELTRYLRHLGIPVYSKRNRNLFDLQLVQQLLQTLRYLASEHQDQPFSGDALLFEILHYNWWGIPPIEIARLSVEAAANRMQGTKSGKKERGTLRGLLAEKCAGPQADLFTPALSPALQQAGNVIELLIGAVPNCTLQHLLEQIVQKTGLLQLILQAPDKHQQLEVLTAFFDFVKEETRRNPQLKLQGLVETLDLMEREELPLPLVQVNGSDQGVNLLTAHGSKGLEFTHVFVAGCNASIWEKKRKPGGGYSLPDTLFAKSSAAGSSDLEELRRLFFVALTRAEQHLTFTYSRFQDNARELEPSLFLAEIQQEHQLPVATGRTSPEVLAEFAALQFTGIIAPELERMEEDFVRPLLENFRMNVTALNNYLRCPLEFYYRTLLRIPSAKNENLEFGSAVHYALEKLFSRMKEDPREQFPSHEQLLRDFEWYMQRHRESFTEEQFQRRMEYGNKVLSDYYEHRVPTLHKVVVLEHTISTVVRDVPIKGKLDKLEFFGKEVNVVDYKTGDPEKGKEKLQPPGDKQPHGGDYWRQAVFYKLLVDHYASKDWRVMSTEFDFVEPDKKKQYRREKLTLTAADAETVTQQIVQVWQKIQERDFYTGCGNADCHWCNFAKDNQLAIALHEVEEEE